MSLKIIDAEQDGVPMKWALKVVAKLLVSRLPLPYGFWKAIGLFRHGRMDSADYPIKIFNLHTARAFPLGLPNDAVILELGPGDSVASALLGFSQGARQVCLVDVGNFARSDVAFYQALALDMKKKGFAVPDLGAAESINDVLQACNARYLTQGITSLRTIPSGSIDFMWSHSVLEHVRRCELGDVLGELRRILKPGGMASHNIDYQDHLDHALNNLRFSEALWESPLFAGAGFYTNRVPAVCLHQMFREYGFDILQEDFGKWPELPTPRSAMDQVFQSFSDDDLLNRTSHVLLRA
jgi:SAM-dependent methyltransferase